MSFESAVLEKLLKWASSSIEKSVNQPTLPHLIIVLNASEVVSGESQWDVAQATKVLMADVAHAIDRDPRIRAYAREWQERGARIQTTSDLLKCFYSSVTVIRIPTKGRYMLLEDQVTKLRYEIIRCCNASLESKKQARMLANGEKLQMYLQSAFDHFSQDLDTPFDFIKEAIKINPLPRDFCGNIIKLAIAIGKYSNFRERADVPRIFQELSHMVASCIVLDSIRQGLPGTPTTLFENYYRGPCVEALHDFSKRYWPCGFENKHGRCSLAKAGHGPKGHQKQDGKILASGDYISDFDPEKTLREWNENLGWKIAELQRKLESKRLQQAGEKSYDDDDEQAFASDIHSTQTKVFFDKIGNVSNFVSHVACFSCLRELPEHPLPCGHVLCTPCVEAYGRRSGKSTILIDSCPLHSSATRWVTSWEIHIKPRYAGVRILSLDGGGVRGIVELEILRAIEQELGGNLPIQAFFDLMVGTSTGGIIALGLGVRNWTVDECIQKFVDLCKKAFEPQKGLNVWGLGYLTTLIHKGKFRTKPFEQALQDEFGRDMTLFGGQNNKDQFKIKVAVTSTTNIESEPIVLTNYNRPEPKKAQYRFERSDHPKRELKIWEAARATSAAPPYFKQFTNPHTSAGYLDGAFYHNNPIWVAFREHQLIWSDVGSLHPDILLSIGTGRKDPATSTFPTRPADFSRPRDPKTFTEQIWSTVDSSVRHMLNCDRRWEQFRTAMIRPGSEGTPRQYIRINPFLRFPVPQLDDVKSLSKLRKEVQDLLRQESQWLNDLATRLVASTFFFEKDHVSIREEENQFICQGRICCRFSNSSQQMRELGKYLKEFMTPEFTPYFLVCEPKKYSFETSKMLPISRQHVFAMSQYGSFQAINVEIKVSELDSESMISLCPRMGDYQRTYSTEEHYDPNNFDDIPISGFPRKLMTEDSLAKKNFRGLVSRTEDPYIDYTMSESVEQLRYTERLSTSSPFRRP